MGGPGRYSIPARRHRVEEVIRRSRFITTVARARDGVAARAFIDDVRAEFEDATHNCWAYVAGPPGSTADVGMSDAGEPHGTAGRPMLDALLHSGVGEIAAVVTRYYGGVQLGRGGLQRAYSGGVMLALETLPRSEHVERVPLVVVIDYAAINPARRAAEELDAQVVGEEYGAEVRLDVLVPANVLGIFRERLLAITGGRAKFERPTG